MRWTPLLLAAAFLLAGCTQEPAPEAATDEPLRSSPEDAAALFGAAARPATTLPAVHFEAGDFNQTVALEGSLPSPETCLIQVDQVCQPAMESFDLGALIPVNAPVELSATGSSDSCLRMELLLEDQGVTRTYYGDDFDDQLAALVVRQAGSSATLQVASCSFLAGDIVADVPFTVEVRTVVRPTVLPSGLPVAVTLAPGDALVAMGSGLDDLVVIPPGQAPRHFLGPFEFNVSSQDPAGTYVVVAKGDGEAMLHGTVGIMRALQVQFGQGEPRPVPSGQELSWEFQPSGVPLWYGLRLESQRDLQGASSGSVLSSFEVALTQGGGDLLRYDEECLGPCHLSLATGYQSRGFGTPYLGENFQAGPVAASVTNDVAYGFQVYETYGYVQP